MSETEELIKPENMLAFLYVLRLSAVQAKDEDMKDMAELLVSIREAAHNKKRGTIYLAIAVFIADEMKEYTGSLGAAATVQMREQIRKFCDLVLART